MLGFWDFSRQFLWKRWMEFLRIFKIIQINQFSWYKKGGQQETIFARQIVFLSRWNSTIFLRNNKINVIDARKCRRICELVQCEFCVHVLFGDTAPTIIAIFNGFHTINTLFFSLLFFWIEANNNFFADGWSI